MKLLNWDPVLWQVLFNAVVRRDDACNVILRGGQVLRGPTDCTSVVRATAQYPVDVTISHLLSETGLVISLISFPKESVCLSSEKYHVSSRAFSEFSQLFPPFGVFPGLPCKGLTHSFLLPFFNAAHPPGGSYGQKGHRFMISPYLCLTAAWKHKGFC